MSNYGHIAQRIGGAFVDTWGAGPYVLTAGGKTFYFEDSSQFGPQRVGAKGDPVDCGIFPERSPFWSVWKRWVEEGRQTVEGKKKGFLYCVVSNGRSAN